MEEIGAAVVLGARNLGASITRDLLRRGTRVAAIARTESDLASLATDGAVPVRADASDASALDEALRRAEAAIGAPTLFVNAISPDRPADGSPFGGGPMVTATTTALETWGTAVARQTLVFLAAASAALNGRRGTIVQITGAPARRANAERGLVAAGMAGVRALTQAAAQELRAAGVHVALLIVDGIIESPKTARMAAGMPTEALVQQVDVAHAVRFLAAQSPRGMTHELVLTPAGDRWVP
jgi:NAD(P)-dependent dehydrogenase (short-subunit alcohol dehydrogenase family)